MSDLFKPKMCEYDQITNHGEGEGVLKKITPCKYVRILFFLKVSLNVSNQDMTSRCVSILKKQIN